MLVVVLFQARHVHAAGVVKLQVVSVAVVCYQVSFVCVLLALQVAAVALYMGCGDIHVIRQKRTVTVCGKKPSAVRSKPWMRGQR